jgi:XTP/dITP diphosphohydrolase
METTENQTSPSSAPILAALERLIDIIAQLRHPETGCPWDLAQTPTSLIPFVIEEAYEVVDALQVGDQGPIAEELGDLLLQAAEKGIAHEPDKLSPKLTKYSRTLPPLMAASKISIKAAKAGFEWETVDDVWDKFHEELGEFRQAIAHEPKANQQAELGDLLFTLVNLARWYDLDPAEALQSTNRRFIRRFELVESAAEKPLGDYSLEELEALWQRAKADLAAAPAIEPTT